MKKGIFSLILVLGLVLCTSIGYARELNVETAVIDGKTSDRVHLREQPSVNSKSFGLYFTGTSVQSEPFSGQEWVWVSVGTQGGYIKSEFLKFGASASTVIPKQPTLVINNKDGSTWTNMRWDTSVNSDIVKKLQKGDSVVVLGETATLWYYVKSGDVYGYIMPDVLAVDDNSVGNRIALVNNYNPADRLNLRKTASTKAESLGKYYNGVVVQMLSEVQNGWIKVRIGNLEGYMESVYLLVDGQIGSVTSATPTVSVSSTNGARLNLREKQSDQSNSLGMYDNGTKVQVLGLSETWYHVQVDGKVGFMMAKYLTPKLQYAYGDGGGTSSSGSSGGNSNGTSGSGSSGGNSSGTWSGPTGTHQIGEWTIPILEYVGIVYNPNPNDRLHLRAEPNENAKSLGRYYNGTQVIIGSEINGEWTEVGIGSGTPSNPTGNNLIGYMKTTFLSIGSPTPPASAMPVMIVSNPNVAGNLHLREKQSTTSNSLGLYPNGTQVTLLGFNDEWAHVMVDGKIGFMQGKYLK